MDSKITIGDIIRGQSNFASQGRPCIVVETTPREIWLLDYSDKDPGRYHASPKYWYAYINDGPASIGFVYKLRLNNIINNEDFKRVIKVLSK